MKDNFPIQNCHLNSPDFPSSLASLSDAPPTLYWRGSLLASSPTIAIVGTRKASAVGVAYAHSFAYALASEGWCIVSGLAFGIDAAAHQGALDAKGVTWAVLAHGLDIIQPRQHEHLARAILDLDGCLISQYPPTTPAYPNQFIARNRIISALCRAVIIIEAPQKSGALSTASYALQQKKKVFVIPALPSMKQFEGSLSLLRKGCRMVRTPQDVLKDMGTERVKKLPLKETPPSREHAILRALKESATPLTIDKLSQITTLSPQDVAVAITQLVLEGIVIEEQDTYCIR